MTPQSAILTLLVILAVMFFALAFVSAKYLIFISKDRKRRIGRTVVTRTSVLSNIIPHNVSDKSYINTKQEFMDLASDWWDHHATFNGANDDFHARTNLVEGANRG